ncbi:MAG: preprotein translocase subunit SecE [Oscillospiraceae bacterium]|nr:preprotein translocase subunit SecE [Oscillospiraceae bacterium]
MSDAKEKTTAEAKVKGSKKPNGSGKKKFSFKKIGEAIKKFFKDFKGECKKINWPSGKTVLNNSLVVIVVVIIVGLVIFAIDTGLSTIIDALVGLASKGNAKDAAETAAEMIRLFSFR